METKSLIAKNKFLSCLDLYNTVRVLSLVMAVITCIADARSLDEPNLRARQDNTSQFGRGPPLLHPRDVVPPTRVEGDQSHHSDNELLPNRSWDRHILSDAKQPMPASNRQQEGDYHSSPSSKSTRGAVTGATSFVATSHNLPFPEHIYNNQESLILNNEGLIDRNYDREEANPHQLLTESDQYFSAEYQKESAPFSVDDRNARPFVGPSQPPNNNRFPIDDRNTRPFDGPSQPPNINRFSIDDRNARPYVGPSQPPNNNKFFQGLPHLLRTELWPRTTGILQSLMNPFRRSSSSHAIRNAIPSQELVLASPQQVQETKSTTNAQLSMSPFSISRSPSTEPHFKIERTHPNPESFVTQSLTFFHSENPTQFNSEPHPPSTPPAFRTVLRKFSSPGPPDQTPFRLEALKAEIVKSPLAQNVPYTPPPKRLKPKPVNGTRRPTMINQISDLITEDMPTDLRYARHICRTTGVCPYSLSWFENSFMRSLVKLAMAD